MSRPNYVATEVSSSLLLLILLGPFLVTALPMPNPQLIGSDSAVSLCGIEERAEFLQEASTCFHKAEAPIRDLIDGQEEEPWDKKSFREAMCSALGQTVSHDF